VALVADWVRCVSARVASIPRMSMVVTKVGRVPAALNFAADTGWDTD